MLFIFIGIFIAIFIGATVYGIRKNKQIKGYWNQTVLNTTVIILSVIAILLCVLIGFVSLSYNYISYTSAKNKIIIVEEANTELESEITESIKQYIQYEGEEFKALKKNYDNAELIAIAETYPKLQSSQLIQTQINTYKENKEEVVKLKKAKEHDKWVIKYWTFINVD